MTSNNTTSSTPTLNPDVWRLCVREYGARGAIRLAAQSGYTGDEILRVNREVRDAAAKGEHVNG